MRTPPCSFASATSVRSMYCVCVTARRGIASRSLRICRYTERFPETSLNAKNVCNAVGSEHLASWCAWTATRGSSEYMVRAFLVWCEVINIGGGFGKCMISIFMIDLGCYTNE